MKVLNGDIPIVLWLQCDSIEPAPKRSHNLATYHVVMTQADMHVLVKNIILIILSPYHSLSITFLGSL